MFSPIPARGKSIYINCCGLEPFGFQVVYRVSKISEIVRERIAIARPHLYLSAERLVFIDLQRF
jgi:hypothetical protein